MSVPARAFFVQAETLAREAVDFVVITWLKSEGHAPQDRGAKAIVTSGGLHWGTVGGGKVEAKAIRFAMSLLQSRQPTPILLRWDLQKDVGMSCGGSVQLLWEAFPARAWSVIIFGAGHVAQALVRTLALLDCHVSCVDTRPEWIDRLPAASDTLAPTLVDDMTSFAATVPPHSYCVLVTQGHATDYPILERLLKRPNLPYLGVIGSRVKARKLRAELMRDGFGPDERDSFQCPMGLGFKSHQPAEIAISIAAELLAVKNGGRGLRTGLQGSTQEMRNCIDDEAVGVNRDTP